MAAEEDAIPKSGASGQGAGQRPKQPLTIDLEAKSSRSSSSGKAEEPATAKGTETPKSTSSEESASEKKAGPSNSSAGRPVPAWPPIAALAGAAAAGGLIVLVLGFGLQAAGILPAPGGTAATEARAEIGNLSNTLNGLDQRVSGIEAASGQAVADRALLDDLSRQVGILDASGTSLGDRLLSVEASVASLKEEAGTNGAAADGARLDTIEARIARLETLPPLESGNGPAPGLQSIRSEVAALTAKMNDLEARLDTLATNAAADEESESAARALAVASLREAAASGGPFVEELSMVESLGGDAAKLDVLGPLAGKGAPSEADLIAEFPAVADAILAAEQDPEVTGSVLDSVLAYGRGLVKIRPTEPVAGDDAAAIVSRMQAAVAAGKLAEALKEREGLSADGKAASESWAAAARDRVAIDAAADGLSETAGASGTNG